MLRHITRALACLVLVTSAATAQTLPEASCDTYLGPQRATHGQQVGPSACRVIDTAFRFEGVAVRRLDMGLTGTVEGYLPKTGYYINYFTSAPDLVFPQGMNEGPIHFGVGRYDMATGHAVVLVYPEQKKAWNGKMYVTLHGRGKSFKNGSLKAWDRNLVRGDPLGDLSKFELLMLRKGYAVAKTFRSSDTLGGDLQVTLDDGTVYVSRNLNDNAQVILDWVEVAESALQARLGKKPSRTYFYGRSAGGRIGRSINYVPGLNVGRDGAPRIDGILSDDSATGLWQPIVMKDGKDVLFATDAEKAAFVPQIDVTHQMYNAETPGDRPAWVSSSYLQNKRWNARTLRDKGLGGKHRIYEIRRVSHDGGEYLPLGGRKGDVEILEISFLFDRFVDLLDAWADKGIAPSPSRSDWVELGDADRDGTIENPAIEMPDIACPLGVYYQFPPSRGNDGDTATSFAAFTGRGLEPLDGRGVFVDMNGNGVWDVRETPTEAWRRLRLLGATESLTRERYASCVDAAASALRQAGFFSDKTVSWYGDQARKADVEPKPAPSTQP